MRKIIRFYKNDGFTIIELLMAIIILGVVMAAITTMIVQSFNVFDSSTRRMSAGQLAELGLSEVGRVLRSAKTIPGIPVDGDEFDEFDDKDKTYSFTGYIDDSDTKEEIVIEFSDNRIVINGEIRLNNVEKFNIVPILDEEGQGTGEMRINIEANDGDNTAIKQSTVNSRNF